MGHQRVVARSAAALLLVGTAIPAHAAGTDSAGAADAAQPASDPRQREIVIIAPPLFPDIRPERELDEQGIEAYGVSTVDELVGELTGELGDEDQPPLIIVNGERLNDLEEIGALPVEALRNVQVLPRGSAVRAGGSSGQRILSLTLKRDVRSATLLAAPKIATEGDWRSARGEAIALHVHGPTRASLTLRGSGDSFLFESERGVVQPAPRLPFALTGNVAGFPDTTGEIDPLLSAAAGGIVTVAPIPGNANPTLADFAAGANDPAVTDLGEFRTLRPRTRNYELNGTYATRLATWLTGNATVRLNRVLSRSERGLPTAEFVLSPDNPASPFSRDVALLFYGRDPLLSRARRGSGEAIVTLNGQFGQWTSNLNLRHFESRDITRTERQDALGTIDIADTVNPFTTDLGALITTHDDRATARSTANLAVLSLTGPALKLPAGDLQATIEGRLAGNRLHSSTTFASSNPDQTFHRSEQSIRVAAEVPITSRAYNFVAGLGDLSATGEFARIHYSDAGNLSRRAIGLTWEPVPILRLRWDIEKADRPPSIQLLGNPVIISPQVRIFDPLTGETVDVVQISGGNPDIDPETTKIRRLSGLLRLVPRLNLQLNAEYTDTDARKFVSSLPEASAAVMLAFPERFVRDVNGVLTTVDLRPVNFDSHREKRLRYGFSVNAAIDAAPTGDQRSRSGPRTRLQLTANHTLVFSDRIVIRPGLDTVNLLEGGAIGIASGRVRHQLDGTAGLTSGGLGARLGVTWRGRSTLESRINGETERLRFSPLLLVNLKAFTDAGRLFGRNAWTKSMRLSLNVQNLFNDRQKVRDSFGDTPLQYQPAYRDPIGRTVELEVRKVF